MSDGEYEHMGERLYSSDDDDDDARSVPEEMLGSHYHSELEGDSYVATGHIGDVTSGESSSGVAGQKSLAYRSVDSTGTDHYGLNKPPPLFGHTAALLPKRTDRGGDVDRMIVFGGYIFNDGEESHFTQYRTRVKRESDVEYLSDVVYLDLTTSLWHKVNCRGCTRKMGVNDTRGKSGSSKGKGPSHRGFRSGARGGGGGGGGGESSKPEGRYGHTATMVGHTSMFDRGTARCRTRSAASPARGEVPSAQNSASGTCAARRRP